jgi:cation:H+ antiporter
MVASGWILLGLAALIAGAELLTRAGSRLAAQLGVPPLVIGLTIVAVGTSAPELAIGIEAALIGAGSLAVGNIAGTNTANILLILGLSALTRPLALHLQTVRFDLPVMTVACVALTAMAWDGELTRVAGVVLVGAAVVYTAAVMRWTRRESRAIRREFAAEYRKPRDGHAAREIARDVALLVVGIALVVVGAGWLVDGAEDLARMIGVSDAVIGLTVVAIGTSAPELVTTIIGTLRNNRDIAIGNLLGSSIYNIFAILGVTCLIPSTGLAVDPELVRIDLPVMTAVALVCVPVFLTGRRVSRLEGALFVGAYVAYLSYLVFART